MMFTCAARSSARHLTVRVGSIHGSASQQSRLMVASSSNIIRNFSVKDFVGASSNAMQLKTTFNLPDPTIESPSGRPYHQLTKIVATIGPTSEQEEPLKKVVRAGMKIMRLNFSHATIEEVELRMKNLALCQVRYVTLRRPVYYGGAAVCGNVV
jgi:hypothetical protein